MSLISNEKKRIPWHCDVGLITLNRCHLHHMVCHLFVYLSLLVYLYAEHILACMHTQYRELPALASHFQSMFWWSPFPIHSAVLSGFRYSLGRAARLATRDAEATAAHPLYTHTHTHSIHRKHCPAYTHSTGLYPLLPGYHGCFHWQRGYGDKIMMCYG